MKINHLSHGTDAAYILDWARFTAALIVFGYHLTGNSILPGYQAVMIFFVLSGFFISSSVLNSMIKGNWSWKYYLVSRLTRLWLVLLPALILSAIWVIIQIRCFGISSVPLIKTGEFSGDHQITTFFQNMFFLQGVTTNHLFGYNGPLWSLSFEFWYYILFPVMILTFTSKNIFKKIVYGTIFIALSIFLGVHIMAYYVIWLLGALIVVTKPITFVKMHPIIILIVSACTIILSIHGLYKVFQISHLRADMSHYIPDLLLALFFALFVYVSITLFSNQNRFSNLGRLGTYLAGMAYTLYLVHYPVLNFINAAKINYWSSSITKIIFYLVVSISILIYADLLSHITERNTSKIKRTILNIVQKRSILVDKAG